MPKRHVPDTLTPTEAAAESLIRRDPIRRMSDAQIEYEIMECNRLMALFSDSTQKHRCQELWDRARRLRDEQARRRAVA